MTGEALGAILQDLDTRISPGNKCILLMENVHLLIQDICENDRTLEVKLTSQNGSDILIQLQSVRIVLLSSKTFCQLSPLSHSLLGALRMKYKY